MASGSKLVETRGRTCLGETFTIHDMYGHHIVIEPISRHRTAATQQ